MIEKIKENETTNDDSNFQENMTARIAK